MQKKEIYSFLMEKAELYENPSFINDDPIQIPHMFSKHQDIEISGFLTALISWGNRKSIINSSKKMMDLLDNDPFNFVINHNQNDLKTLNHFVHRTFNGKDLVYFIKTLKFIYTKCDTLEEFIFKENSSISIIQSCFYENFFNFPHDKRTEKHISNPQKGSASKKMNMFFRWMVRSNIQGVDFGIWKKFKVSKLSCPLDVHSGNVARKLGVLKRKQNDAKAVIELDNVLRKINVKDPVKLDFALFGLAIHEKFK
ncbi:MAG: TIGR02757 family protein [Flavobacteriaceae bacterium]|nr:TIGR02757 family protein [Flavobacteriaceae bacterium]|tara:strand:+ start:8824 stop:9585 length:762 start_codon:yes stop_codon:yes gene_type:complete